MPVTLAASGFVAVVLEPTTIALCDSCNPYSRSQRRPRLMVSDLVRRMSSCACPVVIREFVQLGRNVAAAAGGGTQQHVGQVGARAGDCGQRSRARERAVEGELPGAIGKIVAIVMNTPEIESGLEIVTALEFRNAARKILRVMHVVEVVVGAQIVLRRHRDVG